MPIKLRPKLIFKGGPMDGFTKRTTPEKILELTPEGLGGQPVIEYDPGGRFGHTHIYEGRQHYDPDNTFYEMLHIQIVDKQDL